MLTYAERGILDRQIGLGSLYFFPRTGLNTERWEWNPETVTWQHHVNDQLIANYYPRVDGYRHSEYAGDILFIGQDVAYPIGDDTQSWQYGRGFTQMAGQIQRAWEGASITGIGDPVSTPRRNNYDLVYKANK